MWLTLHCTREHSWLLPEKLLSALLLLQPWIFDSFIKSCYILQSLEKGSGHMNQRWDNCREKKLPWVYKVYPMQHSPLDLLGTWQSLCCLSFTQTGGNCPHDVIKCVTFLLCFLWISLHCVFSTAVAISSFLGRCNLVLRYKCGIKNHKCGTFQVKLVFGI